MTFGHGAIVNIPSAQLSPGLEHRFTAALHIGLRQASSDVIITPITQAEPGVQIQIVPRINLYNVDEMLILTGSVTPVTLASTISFEWSLTSTGASWTVIGNMSQAIMQPYSLLPGCTYTARLRATDSVAAQVGIATITFVTNTPPQTGQFHIAPVGNMYQLLSLIHI